MKKRIFCMVAIVLATVLFFACGSDGIEGTYKDRGIENEFFSQYYSITLKNGKYEFDDVTITGDNKSSVSKSKGKYSLEDGDVIVFTESKGYTFSGNLSEGVLTVTHNYVMYNFTKITQTA